MINLLHGIVSELLGGDPYYLSTPDSLEFSTFCDDISVVALDGNLLLVLHETSADQDSKMDLYSYDSSYNLTWVDNWTFAGKYNPRGCRLNSGEIALVFVDDASSDGFCKVIEYSGAGFGGQQSLEYDTVQALEPSICRVSDTEFAIASIDGDSDCWVDLFSYNGSAITLEDSDEADPVYCAETSIVAMSSGKLACFHSGDANDGYVDYYSIASATLTHEAELEIADGTDITVVNSDVLDEDRLILGWRKNGVEFQLAVIEYDYVGSPSLGTILAGTESTRLKPKALGDKHAVGTLQNSYINLQTYALDGNDTPSVVDTEVIEASATRAVLDVMDNEHVAFVYRDTLSDGQLLIMALEWA